MEMNAAGRVLTIEGSPAQAKISRDNLKSLGLENIEVIEGRFSDALPPLLEKENKVDLAFIDGHHDGQATLDYFQTFLPKMSDSGILIFDDISWSAGMRQAWEEIAGSEAVCTAIDFKSVGMVIIDRNCRGKTEISMPLF